MPIKKAAVKDIKQSARHREKNLRMKTAIRKDMKALRAAAVQKDAGKAAELLQKTVKQLDTAASSGVLKKNTASRLKSRLTKLVNTLRKA